VTKREGNPGYYEIHRDEAAIVRRIFSFVADEGLTIRKLSRRLHELGITPPRSPRAVWPISTLSRLLRNKTYIGEAHFGATYGVVPEKPLKKEAYRKRRKTSRRMRPESEWIRTPTPAILDKELFMRAQQRLEANFGLARRNRKHDYLLSGKIRCACGYSRSAAGLKQGKYLYYWCSSRTRSYPLSRTCTQGAINARIADQLVWEKVAQLMTSKELLAEQVKRWASNRRASGQTSEVDIDLMQKEISKLKRQEDRYAKAYAEGLFSLGKLQGYTSPVREKIMSLEKEIARAHASKKDIDETAPLKPHEIEAFAESAARALADLNFEAKRSIVMNVIDKVVATKELLEIHGVLPVPDHIGLCTSNRGEANTIRYATGRVRSIPFDLVIPLPPSLKKGSGLRS
jgi:site-specific DNA recombinase